MAIRNCPDPHILIWKGWCKGNLPEEIWLIMDLAKESLDDLIKAQDPTGAIRKISFRRKMEIALGVAKGMSALHRHPQIYM